MEKIILDKATVLKNGVNFENLAYEYEDYGDMILDDYAENGGQPFTGLAYELHDNDNLAYYCVYKDGFPDGDYVEFYSTGTIQSVSKMRRGRCIEEEKWHQNGKLEGRGKYECGICISCEQWNENGELIYKKDRPTDDEKLMIKKGLTMFRK